MIKDEGRVSTSANWYAAAILSAILLVIVRQTKQACELELEFNGSNPYMKFGRNPI